MGTSDNLREAFAGESQANQTYMAFAKKAEADGFPQVAKLFRAAAQAERVHAQAHLAVTGRVKGTANNIETAMSGEAHEFMSMYPGFLSQAEAEGNKDAATSFSNALQVEKIHHGLYSQALDAVKAGKDLPASLMFVCSVCGNTVAGKPPDKCPICTSPKSKFSEVT